jgi:hypothetical protein
MMKFGRMNCSLSSVRSSVVLLSLCFSALALTFSGCSKAERTAIGSNIDSPIAMVSHPTLPVSYVLNAVLGGEYDKGSVQAFEVSPRSAIKLLGTSEAPRLGTALAVAKNGAFLVAGFSGTVSELRVFQLDAQGIATPSSNASDRLVLPAGRIGSVKLVQLTGQQDWLVVISQADRSYEAKLFVYRYTPAVGFQKLLSAPDDFYTPSRESALGAYTMAWGSPIVFESLGLMVAFPYGTLGYLGVRPSALDWVTGKADTSSPLVDMRIVSALVVDLNRLRAGENSQAALGFVPLAFNAEGQAGNAQNADAPENRTLEFRTSYQSALAIDTTGSSCQPNAPAAALTANSAVVTLNNRGADLVALGGFNTVSNELRARLEQGQKQPVLGNLLKPQPLYITPALTGAAETDTLIPALQLVRAPNLCTLMWLRVERGRSILGEERSQFQVMTAAVGSEQAKLSSPLPGMASFAVNGSVVLGGSFGANQLQQFNFDGTSLQAGGFFK